MLRSIAITQHSSTYLGIHHLRLHRRGPIQAVQAFPGLARLHISKIRGAIPNSTNASSSAILTCALTDPGRRPLFHIHRVLPH